MVILSSFLKNSYMKQLWCFLVVLLIQATSYAQRNDEKQIRAILSQQSSAWNKGNLTAFMQGYWKSDSLLFVGKSGPTYGFNQTLANYQKSYPDTAAMGKLAFTILDIKKIAGDCHFVLGKWHLTRTIGDVSGHFTLIFRKIKGEWVIVSDHSS